MNLDTVLRTFATVEKRPAASSDLIGILALVQLASMEAPAKPSRTDWPFQVRLDGIEIQVSDHIPAGTALPLGPHAYAISAADYERAVESGRGLRRPSL